MLDSNVEFQDQMDYSCRGEGPATLQLHKWNPSQVQLNLSEFREAFISPTRELLLLLSYQCEALLLPLIRGNSINSDDPETYDHENLQSQQPSSFSASAAPSRSDSGENMPCTSESVNNDILCESCFSKSSGYPFVCDVNSLAWGVCGDTYNQHNETYFRELLFVSGSHGVTVHAFCRHDKLSETIQSTLDGQFEQGMWVEWGPSTTSDQYRELQRNESLHHVASSIVLDVNGTSGTKGTNSFSVQGGDDESSRSLDSKRWLQSFLTKVETVKSEGQVWTRFPEKPSYPCSAKVVSFSVFDSKSPLLDLLFHANSATSGKKNSDETELDLVDEASVMLDSTSYKCSKVFSSNSHQLIGFVLKLGDFVPVNTGDVTETSSNKILLAIARLDGWGIQWVCSVKLDEGPSMTSAVGWMDFQFSDNLLVCLNASGLIFFYSTMTGEYVAHLDVLHSCGFKPQSSLQEQGTKLFVGSDLGSSNGDLKIKQVDGVNGKSTYRTRNFRRLVVASHTSLLAVVDEYGVIYVLYAGHCLPEKYYSFEKLLPHFQHLGLGILAGWEISRSEIGHPLVFSNCHSSNISTVMDDAFSARDNTDSSELQKDHYRNVQDRKGVQCGLHFSGFSDASKIMNERFPSSELLSHPMRKIFLPINKFREDDIICFSPLGITQLVKKQGSEGNKSFQIVHSSLYVDSVADDESLNFGCESLNVQWREKASEGEAVGCTFQGCFYLVTQGGLSVVLPSISISPNFLPIEAIGYRQPSISTGIRHQVENILEIKGSKQPWSPWKVEILDRVLLYEGPEAADCLCLENGWDLRISRMRRLQLGLAYLKFDEMEQSLEMLASVNQAEEGILRLILAAVHLMFHKIANDNEVSAASRLLALATCFATKMIRKYGVVQHYKDAFLVQGVSETQIYSLPLGLLNKEQNDMENSRKLHEMSHFLEIIRNLQCRLSEKFKRPGQVLADGGEAFNEVETNLLRDDAQLSKLSADAIPVETLNQDELSFPASQLGFNDAEKLAWMAMESLDSNYLDSKDFGEVSALVSQDSVLGKAVLPMENPKDMIARWEIDNLDLKTVVKDALLSGRLPLAVLQLHLHHLKDLVNDKEPHDTFAEVRDIGRAIAYDLFLKGETALAVATLQRLGEDIETSLKQLAFGTIRRSLRMQIVEEMKRYGYLGPYEWKILDRISLIERLYPSSSFWRTVLGRKKEYMRGSLNSESSGAYSLHILPSHIFNNLIIECGEIDGAILGSWATVNDSTAVPVPDEDSAAGYWAAAAVWSDAWDQRTIDRIVLDQPFLVGVQVLWESQLEYHICHNDWAEVSKLLDVIPASLISYRSLQISLDSLQSDSTVGCNREFPDYSSYICSIEELDAVCIDVPDIKIFRLPANNMCSIWLRMFMEKELAKKFIFLKEYWEGTAEILPLLAHSDFITERNKIPIQDESIDNSSDLNISNIDGAVHADTVQALHRLVIHHCAQYNLPNLLDIYLDHHKLALDNESLSSLQEAAGDCHWAKWLLLSRIKGCEYDASFSNARSMMSRNSLPRNNLNILEMDEIIRTVDDIAEGGGEMAALATLMYAPVPIQNCLSSGSVNRHYNSSAQCTLENLRPTLQHFPTLWRTLVAASFGHDATSNFLPPKAKNVFGNSALSDYLNWRDNIFFSTGRDTSLLQMLPCWFPKAVRRLIQLYIQGPLGWQSLESFLPRDMDLFVNSNDQVDISAVSWEGAIQKHVEEELYAKSLRESGLGLEQHLHRGRALAAFNHLLGVRVQKLKSEYSHKGQSSASVNGQTNVQSDLQMLLAPITQSEESLLSSVTPLAILHFEDSVLVASCAFLLELCGLSASMLRIDIAALRRISSFYKSSEYTEHYRQLSPKGSALHAVSHEADITNSLARALADDYMRHDGSSILKQKGTPNSVTSKQPSRALMLVLQHLEKVSLPLMADGKTCGSWLFSGNDDGAELRSQQKAASQHWNLVTVFCQMHQIPLSTKYLTVLARDNDWVGFLSEAQVGGYPFETVIQVASREFSDPRLKIHISTVLKGMLSRKKVSSSSNSDTFEKRNGTSFADEKSFVPVELFGILAECEKKKNPGEALLVKAKELCWSVLAMIASCFPDVSSLSCLTVWLEITAARETSSIKVNDIASQIANSVGAAVGATNSLPVGDRALTFHYNRRSPKRRRLLEPISLDSLADTTSDVSCVSDRAKIFSAQGIIAEEERKSDVGELTKVSIDSDEGAVSLSKMVAVLCEQSLFLPLLRAFEMFLPSCSLLPFIRALQAFSQMRLSEASAHLGSFSARIKEEAIVGRGQIGTSWISSTAVKAADAMLSTCPSPYEKRCLLQLLAATDFGDGGSAATCYRRLYWKINLAEPSLRKDDGLHLGNETLDDSSLLTALEKNGHWEQARNWARQLEASGGPWKSAVHHVTETQAESMVAEWKEFLWDVPEERVALWNHCQTLFLRYSSPALQAGLFFLKHAEAVEKDLPARELHELLLLSLQWLSGMMTLSNPVYPLHLLREIETRVWLLAVESEAQVKGEGDFSFTGSSRDSIIGNTLNIIDRTASIITKMDNHINTMRNRPLEKNDVKENNQTHHKNPLVLDASFATAAGGNPKTKRRAKGYVPSRRLVADTLDKSTEPEDGSSFLNSRNDLQLQDENFKLEVSFSRWAERVGPGELERAVLSLLEFGQITAAKQLQHKLSPAHTLSQFVLVDAALKLAAMSTPCHEVPIAVLDEDVRSVIRSYSIMIDHHMVNPLEVLESLETIFTEGSGRGLCKKIIAIVKAANVLGLSFSEAFSKQPIEVLQLLSLKAQDSFVEVNLLVQSHTMPAASIARILAESFLKGLLAAHRGGYMDSQKEEGPAPLLWRFSDFLEWAELCPSEQEIGHALMRLVITGQEIPHACEVELLILAHHFYKSSDCLDGVDVLVSLAANRVEAYVVEGDFHCLARLITGVKNFYALNFILGILIENGQLDLLLQKYSAAETDASTAEDTMGFQVAVLTSLKHFNPNDLDAFALVYNHFDMKHETAALLESQAEQSYKQWFLRNDRDQNEDLLESMRYYIEAAEVLSTIDAGNTTRRACAKASLVSLQIRMPDFQWLNLSETNARRALVEQSRFQEALIVAEAYDLNWPSEWALVLWNLMLKPELTERFVAEFVLVLPLHPSMLADLARFYRAEVAARGDQSQFSIWLTGGGVPAEWLKYLGRSFRCLLKMTRDLRLQLQLAQVATGFGDVIDACNKELDKVPDNAGPLVLRKGHGGAYLPLM